MPFLHPEEGLFFAYYATADRHGAVFNAFKRILCAPSAPDFVKIP